MFNFLEQFLQHFFLGGFRCGNTSRAGWRSRIWRILPGHHVLVEVFQLFVATVVLAQQFIIWNCEGSLRNACTRFCAEKGLDEINLNHVFPWQVHESDTTVTSRFVCVILAMSRPHNSLHSSSKWWGFSPFCIHHRIQTDVFSDCALAVVNSSVTALSSANR